MRNPPLTLTVERSSLAAVESILLKAKAGELSDLRRAQTQLSVYADRRGSMAGEPAAIEARLAVLSDLLDQIERQRGEGGGNLRPG
jgi:hypothetical protein